MRFRDKPWTYFSMVYWPCIVAFSIFCLLSDLRVAGASDRCSKFSATDVEDYWLEMLEIISIYY